MTFSTLASPGVSLQGGGGSGGGGGGTPGGSNTQIQYNSSGTFAGASGLTTNGTELTIASGTITASQPVLDLSQTWNNGATTFTALKFNATDTASAAASLLMDLQVGGASQASFDKRGTLSFAGPASGTAPSRPGIGNWFNTLALFGTGGTLLATLSGGRMNISGELALANDVLLSRRAAANLRLGAADAAAPVAQTLSVQSASATGADQAGAAFTITGSQGRGGGAGGSIIFQVAPAGTGGSGAVNGLATTAQFGPFQGKLYLNSATPTASNYAIWGDGTNAWLNAPTSGGYVHFGSNDNWGVAVHPASVRISSTITLGWTASNPAAALDLILARDAANTLALRNGANAQQLNIYRSFTSDTVHNKFSIRNTGVFWFLETSDNGTSGGDPMGVGSGYSGSPNSTLVVYGAPINFRSRAGNTATVWSFDINGHFTAGTDNTYDIGASGGTRPRNLYVAGTVTIGNNSVKSTISNSGNGRTFIDTPLLQLGLATASGVAIKQSGTTLQVRLADDSANTALESASIKTGAPTGGTSGTWKLGTRVAATTTLDTTQYIEVDVGGTLYKLAVVTS